MAEWIDADGLRRCSFSLSRLPTSINKINRPIWSEKRFRKSDEAWEWECAVKPEIPRFKPTDGSLLHLDMVFHYAFHSRNSRLRRRDSQNLLKLAIDVIAAKQGWDDSRVKSGSWDSVDSPDERVYVTIIEVLP